MTKQKNDRYSPSIQHHAMADRIKKLLTFNGRDVAAWKRKLRRTVAALTGFDRMPGPKDRPPLNVRTLWRRKVDLGVIEKIVFTAEPYADVPAYVCLPAKARPPYTWFICLQGHSTGMHNSIAVDFETNRKPIVVEGDRDFGLGCMRRGIAALCIEQRGLGERSENAMKKPSPTHCQDAAGHALMLGRTVIGERVFDVDRAIDYLMTRDDVNRRTIGVMGNSGGGTTSLFAAALLPRLQLCMPSCYFCTFRDSILAMYHCACNYVPGLLRYAEMADIMGLFAPKPVVIVAGKTDPIFPIKAVQSEFRRLKTVYRAAGATERCHLIVGSEGHRFYAEKAWRVMLAEIRGRLL